MTGSRRPTNMEYQITLRVRPGETVRFPALCVACGQPSVERLTLQKRRGQITRRVDAPLCAECARRLARRSGQEEQLIRLGRLAGAGVALLLAAAAFLAFPIESWALRLVIGLGIGLAGGAWVFRVLARRAEAAELPERRAVREAAGIVDFNWREMTLAFVNRDIAERVREMNAAILDDEALGDEAVVTVADVTALEDSAPPADE